jgi:ribosomal silencing factor RsfS
MFTTKPKKVTKKRVQTHSTRRETTTSSGRTSKQRNVQRSSTQPATNLDQILSRKLDPQGNGNTISSPPSSSSSSTTTTTQPQQPQLTSNAGKKKVVKKTPFENTTSPTNLNNLPTDSTNVPAPGILPLKTKYNAFLGPSSTSSLKHSFNDDLSKQQMYEKTTQRFRKVNALDYSNDPSTISGNQLINRNWGIQNVLNFLKTQKVSNMVVFDSSSQSITCDYTIVCNVASTKPMQALTSKLVALGRMNKALGYEKFNGGDDPDGLWNIANLSHIVVHVLTPAGRTAPMFQRAERKLLLDAKLIPVEQWDSLVDPWVRQDRELTQAQGANKLLNWDEQKENPTKPIEHASLLYGQPAPPGYYIRANTKAIEPTYNQTSEEDDYNYLDLNESHMNKIQFMTDLGYQDEDVQLDPELIGKALMGTVDLLPVLDDDDDNDEKKAVADDGKKKLGKKGKKNNNNNNENDNQLKDNVETLKSLNNFGDDDYDTEPLDEETPPHLLQKNNITNISNQIEFVHESEQNDNKKNVKKTNTKNSNKNKSTSSSTSSSPLKTSAAKYSTVNNNTNYTKQRYGVLKQQVQQFSSLFSFTVQQENNLPHPKTNSNHTQTTNQFTTPLHTTTRRYISSDLDSNDYSPRLSKSNHKNVSNSQNLDQNLDNLTIGGFSNFDAAFTEPIHSRNNNNNNNGNNGSPHRLINNPTHSQQSMQYSTLGNSFEENLISTSHSQYTTTLKPPTTPSGHHGFSSMDLHQHPLSSGNSSQLHKRNGNNNKHHYVDESNFESLGNFSNFNTFDDNNNNNNKNKKKLNFSNQDSSSPMLGLDFMLMGADDDDNHMGTSKQHSVGFGGFDDDEVFGQSPFSNTNRSKILLNNNNNNNNNDDLQTEIDFLQAENGLESTSAFGMAPSRSHLGKIQSQKRKNIDINDDIGEKYTDNDGFGSQSDGFYSNLGEVSPNSAQIKHFSNSNLTDLEPSSSLEYNLVHNKHHFNNIGLGNNSGTEWFDELDDITKDNHDYAKFQPKFSIFDSLEQFEGKNGITPTNSGRVIQNIVSLQENNNINGIDNTAVFIQGFHHDSTQILNKSHKNTNNTQMSQFEFDSIGAFDEFDDIGGGDDDDDDDDIDTRFGFISNTTSHKFGQHDFDSNFDNDLGVALADHSNQFYPGLDMDVDDDLQLQQFSRLLTTQRQRSIRETTLNQRVVRWDQNDNDDDYDEEFEEESDGKKIH